MQTNNHSSHEVPKSGVSYFTKVNGKVTTFDHQVVTGREVLLESKHDPEANTLYIKLSDGGKKPIGLDEKVDLGTEGIEKFRVLPKKLTDGRGERPPAPITDEDWAFLEKSEHSWNVSPWQGNQLLTIRSVQIPAGYNVDAVDVRVVIPATYPSAQLDMFYFKPHLTRIDGRAIHAITQENFNGEIWQRWSRHRGPGSEWIPGIDDVSTHVALMRACLETELGR